MGDASLDTYPTAAYDLLPVPNPTTSVWQSSHPNPIAHLRSTPHLPSRATVAIIGSGITAAFAAHRLLELLPDLDVLVLEARGTCSGATGRNGGHLRASTFGEPEDVIDFERKNFDFVSSFIEDHEIPCELRRLQACHAFWRQEYFEEAKQDWKAHQDPSTRAVEGAAGLQKLRLQGAIGAFEIDEAASLSPYKLVIWMWDNMLKKHPGLNLQTDTPVSALNPDSTTRGCKIETARGIIDVDHVLITTNAYSGRLLTQFRDLITPVQCWMSALTPPAGSPFSSELLNHSYGMSGVGPQDRVQDDYLVQRPLEESAQLMFGGARAQVKGSGVGDWDDSHVPEVARDYLRSMLGRMLNLESPLTQKTTDLPSCGEWGGIMGFSRDRCPWVGAVPGVDNVYLAAGFSGHGRYFCACGSWEQDIDSVQAWSTPRCVADMWLNSSLGNSRVTRWQPRGRQSPTVT